MKSIIINGSTRKVLGKKSTKELRKQEMVPCVLYGEGEPRVLVLWVMKEHMKNALF